MTEEGCSHFKHKLFFSEDEMKSNLECDFSWKFKDVCIQAKTAQFHAFGISYTQPILDNCGFGAEVYLSPFQDKGRLKFVGLYNNKEEKEHAMASFSTGMGPDQFTATYLKKITESLGILAEADFTVDRTPKAPGGGKLVSVFKLGYSFKSELQGTSAARAVVDTTGGVACIVEDATEFGSLTACAKINYFKNLYDFGFGVSVAM